MISKFLSLELPLLSRTRLLTRPPLTMRAFGNFIPPSQYDMPRSKKLQILYVMKTYWETIPLFITNSLAIGVVLAQVIWACKNKVDCVFTTHSRDNISRTMDLRNPEIHKIRIINQRYEPWPEMQEVLDKMKTAERREKDRLESCKRP